jgi:hypothetical protein
MCSVFGYRQRVSVSIARAGSSCCAGGIRPTAASNGSLLAAGSSLERRPSRRHTASCPKILDFLPSWSGPPPSALLADEVEQFLGYRWFTMREVKAFPERIEPPQLLEILDDLSRLTES